MLKKRIERLKEQAKKAVIGVATVMATSGAPSFANPAPTADKAKEKIELSLKEKLELSLPRLSPEEQEQAIRIKTETVMQSYLEAMRENISELKDLKSDTAKYNDYKSKMFEAVYAKLDETSPHCVAGAMKSMQNAAETTPELKAFMDTIEGFAPSWAPKDFKHALVSCPLFREAIREKYSENAEGIVQEGKLVPDMGKVLENYRRSYPKTKLSDEEIKTKLGIIDINTLKPGDGILVHVGTADYTVSGMHYITYAGKDKDGIHRYHGFNKEAQDGDLMKVYGVKKMTVVSLSKIIENNIRETVNANSPEKNYAYLRGCLPKTYDASKYLLKGMPNPTIQAQNLRNRSL